MIPLPSAIGWLWASIFSGDVSKILARRDRLARMEIGEQLLFRGGLGNRHPIGLDFVGMNMPLVRLSRIRYVDATRATSSGVTFSIRSRYKKYSRQSPCEAQLLSSTARSLVLAARSSRIFQNLAVRARSTSSAVIFVLPTFSGPFQHRRQGVLERIAQADLGEQLEHARIVPTAGVGPDAGRLLRLDDRFIEPARGGVAQHFGQDIERGQVGMGAGRNVIDGPDQAQIAHAAQHHRCARRLAAALRCRSRSSLRVGLGIGPKYFSISSSVLASSNLPATISIALSV